MSSVLVRLRLDVAYDGGGFSGWAAQPGRRTVAGVLTEVLERLFRADGVVGLTVAGRTDAGVHATGQVCHVDVPETGWERLGDSTLRRLNGLLPPDIRVATVTPALAGFNARFAALSRAYEYRVTDDPTGPPPLRRHDVLGWPRQLDLDRLRAASVGLVGLHDFAAFCRRRENATTIRAVTKLDWQRDGAVLTARIEADAFCWSMVRSLMGALLLVGDGRREPDWPAQLLSRTVRADDVPVAPAHGLTLVAVSYPETSAELLARAELTRNLRG